MTKRTSATQSNDTSTSGKATATAATKKIELKAVDSVTIYTDFIHHLQLAARDGTNRTEFMEVIGRTVVPREILEVQAVAESAVEIAFRGRSSTIQEVAGQRSAGAEAPTVVGNTITFKPPSTADDIHTWVINVQPYAGSSTTLQLTVKVTKAGGGPS